MSAEKSGGSLTHAPTPEQLSMVARRFRILAAPARLLVLHTLEEGACSVTTLARRTGLAVGTLSRHLHVLYANGFVRRQRVGQFVHYQLADEEILELCELMCGRLAAEVQSVRGTFAAEV